MEINRLKGNQFSDLDIIIENMLTFQIQDFYEIIKTIW